MGNCNRKLRQDGYLNGALNYPYFYLWEWYLKVLAGLHWGRKKKKKESSFLRLSHQRPSWVLFWEKELSISFYSVQFDSDLNQGKIFSTVKKTCKFHNRGGKSGNMIIYIHLWLYYVLNCETNDWLGG